jgi:hypothetical protein
MTRWEVVAAIGLVVGVVIVLIATRPRGDVGVPTPESHERAKRETERDAED